MGDVGVYEFVELLSLLLFVEEWIVVLGVVVEVGKDVVVVIELVVVDFLVGIVLVVVYLGGGCVKLLVN